MLKKVIILIILSTSFYISGFSQDSNLNNLTVNSLEKSGGASKFDGWGLKNDNVYDQRPNFSGGLAYVINNHHGLTFSAHSQYGGIRFYNQGYPNNPLDPSAGAIMAMSINNGFVGIGTTNPKAALDVGTDIRNQKIGAVLGRLPEGDNTGEGTFLGVRGYNTTEDYGRKSFALEHSFYGVVNSSINFFRGGSTEGGFMAFNTSSNIERMRIDPSGNVGIGTALPRERLSVNGNIRAREVKVENNNWPDYVFNNDYDLPSLSSVKLYVDQNHHLPGIPSAGEVAREGVNLGEVNAKLLKKIEELTLYLFDKEEEIQNEKKVNKIQQSQLLIQENTIKEIVLRLQKLESR